MKGDSMLLFLPDRNRCLPQPFYDWSILQDRKGRRKDGGLNVYNTVYVDFNSQNVT